jgi:hypothetical protein
VWAGTDNGANWRVERLNARRPCFSKKQRRTRGRIVAKSVYHKKDLDRERKRKSQWARRKQGSLLKFITAAWEDRQSSAIVPPKFPML